MVLGFQGLSPVPTDCTAAAPSRSCTQRVAFDVFMFNIYNLGLQMYAALLHFIFIPLMGNKTQPLFLCTGIMEGLEHGQQLRGRLLGNLKNLV